MFKFGFGHALKRLFTSCNAGKIILDAARSSCLPLAPWGWGLHHVVASSFLITCLHLSLILNGRPPMAAHASPPSFSFMSFYVTLGISCHHLLSSSAFYASGDSLSRHFLCTFPVHLVLFLTISWTFSKTKLMLSCAIRNCKVLHV